jgi:hypothetical protein
VITATASQCYDNNKHAATSHDATRRSPLPGTFSNAYYSSKTGYSNSSSSTSDSTMGDDRRESNRTHYLSLDELVASHPDIFQPGVALHMFGKYFDNSD